MKFEAELMSAFRPSVSIGSLRRTFLFLFPNSSLRFPYLKIPIKDPIYRFQFQLTTKLVSSNSLFPIPFLACGPFLIFIRLFLFQISIFSMCRSRQRLKRMIYCNNIIYKYFQVPNFIWHCGGYDKLKPFGITIHSCIDRHVTDMHDSIIFNFLT